MLRRPHLTETGGPSVTKQREAWVFPGSCWSSGVTQCERGQHKRHEQKSIIAGGEEWRKLEQHQSLRKSDIGLDSIYPTLYFLMAADAF